MLLVSNDVFAISHGITPSWVAIKSKEYVFCVIDLANRPSPHPKSATIKFFGLKKKKTREYYSIFADYKRRRLTFFVLL